MIEKVANNKTNREKLNLNPVHLIDEKLEYYRSLIGRISTLPEPEFESLCKDVAIFFNIKPVLYRNSPPEYLFRISNNTKIIESQKRELGLFTEISQLLAPPVEFCGYNRCNIPGQRVLYCATDESTAYWETKPQKGDLITISLFKLKEGAKINCSVIGKEKIKDKKANNQLHEVYLHLEDFFLEIYSREIARDTPKEYIFSSILSSEQLFYPIDSPDNIEAIIYPSVQRKKHGFNFAIKNDLILKYYDLVEITTRFIIEEYKDKKPNEVGPTTDDVVGSIRGKDFDFNNNKINYADDINKLFKILRDIQISICDGSGTQVRYNPPIPIKKIDDLVDLAKKEHPIHKVKYNQNCRVNVIYKDGRKINGIKFKKVKKDFDNSNLELIKKSDGNKPY